MAEILGIITGITTLIDASIKVVGVISTAAENYGAATAQINSIANDARIIAMSLGVLEKRMNEPEYQSDDIVKLAERLIAVCRADFNEINHQLLPFFTSQSDRLGRAQKVRWLYTRAKLSVTRTSLESSKTSLSLFIMTLDSSENRAFRADVRGQMRGLDASDVRPAFVAAEKEDEARASQFQDAQDRSRSPWEQNSVKMIDGGPSQQKLLEPPEFSRNYDMATTISRAESSEFLAQNDDEMILSISDDQFLKIADHMMVRRLLVDFALRRTGDSQRRLSEPNQQDNSTSSSPFSADERFSSFSENHHQRTRDDAWRGTEGYSQGRGNQPPPFAQWGYDPEKEELRRRLAVFEKEKADKEEEERFKAEVERKLEQTLLEREEKIKKEAEAAAATEAKAQRKIAAAIKAEAEAKAAAEAKAREEAEMLKQIEEDARIRAEIEAREKIRDEWATEEAANKVKKEEEAFKKRALEEAKLEAGETNKKPNSKDKAPVKFRAQMYQPKERKWTEKFQRAMGWSGIAQQQDPPSSSG